MVKQSRLRRSRVDAYAVFRCFCALVVFSAATSVIAQQKATDEELATKLNNPVSSLISVPFQFNWDHEYGPERSGHKFQLNVQPVIPVRLTPDWNLIARVIVPVTRCIYKPQVELLDYLRANAFKTFIVSGGGVDFIRAFAEEAYGIPREQVIGSSGKLRYELQGDRAVPMKASELDSFDDREAKPANIGLHIGRRPLPAFGNSDGDLAMLRYAASGGGACLALLLHHDDAAREAAYDRDFRLSPLAEALDKAEQYRIRIVSMKRDWNALFPD